MMYYINILEQEFSSAKPMSIICLMRGMSLLCIGVIWLLSLVCFLMRIMIRFLRESGYLNFTKDHINIVLF